MWLHIVTGTLTFTAEAVTAPWFCRIRDWKWEIRKSYKHLQIPTYAPRLPGVGGGGELGVSGDKCIKIYRPDRIVFTFHENLSDEKLPEIKRTFLFF